MSTAPVETVPTGEAQEASQTSAPAADEPLGEPGKKALEAERAAAKEARRQVAELEARVKAYETEKMSDLEKAQTLAAEAAKRAEAAEARATRAEIATEYGITKADAELFLTGTDTETLTRQAKALAERAATPSTPKPDLTQGRGSTVKASTESQFEEFFKSSFSA